MRRRAGGSAVTENWREAPRARQASHRGAGLRKARGACLHEAGTGAGPGALSRIACQRQAAAPKDASSGQGGVDLEGATGGLFFCLGNQSAHSKTEWRCNQFAHIRQCLSKHVEVRLLFRIWNPRILSEQHRAKKGQRAPTLHRVSSAPELISTCQFTVIEYHNLCWHGRVM